MQPSSCARRRAFGEASGVWDIDLWEQHGVLSPLMQQQLRGWSATKYVYCETCYVIVTNWLDVGNHVRRTKHRQAMANAAESSKEPEPAIEHATEPRGEVNIGSWPSHLPHAQTGRVSAASSEPPGGAGPNLWLEGGERFGDRFVQTWIPWEWNTRVEEKGARAGSWENRDKSWEPKGGRRWTRRSEEELPEEQEWRHRVCRPEWN